MKFPLNAIGYLVEALGSGVDWVAWPTLAWTCFVGYDMPTQTWAWPPALIYYGDDVASKTDDAVCGVVSSLPADVAMTGPQNHPQGDSNPCPSQRKLPSDKHLVPHGET